MDRGWTDDGPNMELAQAFADQKPEGRFERLIHGLSFQDERLNELQKKSVTKGLRGDEVFEFICLDRKELLDKIDALEKNLAKVLGYNKILLGYALADRCQWDNDFLTEVGRHIKSLEEKETQGKA